jgi:LPS-assembly lipoprotein
MGAGNRPGWLSSGLIVSALLGIGLGLAGCGFTPMYATPGVSPGLASIQVTAPDGRVGYLLREDLDDALGRNRSAPAAYRLSMVIDQTRTPRGLSVTDVAERYVVGLHVKYTLTELATGKVAHTGEVSSQVSYDAADQPYAGIAARQDSQQRAAADAARQIQLDLAVWMSKTKGG